MAAGKIVVLDDDPTGSQTVHGCLLLTRWDAATLREALADASPLFFVLTNTRGMDAARASAVTREVCVNLREALAGSDATPILVSRSDSTLRGHYPVETDVIAEVLGPFDAHFLVPAFFEGGRITRDSVHYVRMDGRDVPAHETEFARDSVFGYRTSYLPDYVEEKTRGRIPAVRVHRFLLDDVRSGAYPRLMSLHGNACAVVDAEQQADLDRFAADLRSAVNQGKRFLFRSAASLLTALAGLPPQPVAPEAMWTYVRGRRPGAVLVGSHVSKTTRQLERLLRIPGIVPVEADVERLPADRPALLAEVIARAADAHAGQQTPVIYTSRTEKYFSDRQARLAFGESVSAFLTDVVRGLPRTLGYLISKGGITSNDVLAHGLALRTARVLGQILPGCSIVRCPADHPRFPDLPVVVFPGNVGDDDGLATVHRRLTGQPDRE
ncbi:Hrp-dependent type III effector protein [Sulfurifustis variabilis]|uniref:Hrp-dependent type III effector protein n=1 Tax=Sulfurifustis variabilis TaxID=1675686 RepID=A0A1B4V127_9GAMM|nr:four-carbon acid sugar kinase family protein [Sulfurifustis variabilis]BAU47053.1 Hrp-dependent type III effector protein [Sulfurifustis variabilis]